MDLTSKSGIPSQGAGFQVVAPMGGEDKAPQDNKRGLEEQAADLCGLRNCFIYSVQECCFHTPQLVFAWKEATNHK